MDRIEGDVTQPVIVLRPEPGQTATLVAAHEAGLRSFGMPLCAVESVAWTAPPRTYDGFLIGSANALRYAGEELAKVAHLPALCVGAATAEAARHAGLRVERVGQGGLQSLLDGLEGETRTLLRLAGETHLPLMPPPGIAVELVVTYRAEYHRLTRPQARFLANGGTVLLHSGEMAAHFGTQCDAQGIERTLISCAALAPRIAEKAGPGWREVAVAHTPNDTALLAVAKRLCDKRP